MGKIERINLRGISRSPSDRMLTDGGCAESLNVQLDHNEIVPMPKPDDITEDVLGDNTFYTVVLYIHKGTYYTNYIYGRNWSTTNPNINRYRIYAKVGDSAVELTSFDYDINDAEPSQVDVTSVGNTLVVSFNGEMRYILFKDGEYNVLGNHIPEPIIRFYMKYDRTGGVHPTDLPRVVPTVSYPTKRTVEGRTVVVSNAGPVDSSAHDGSYDLDPEKWGSRALAYKVKKEPQLAILNGIWEEIRTQMNGAVEGGKHIFPVFLRYGVRLYDGSLYACSAPILMGGELASNLAVGLTSFRTSKKEKVYIDDVHSVSYTIYQIYAWVETPHPYFIVADFAENDLGWDAWKDIVEGVELYVSTPIMPMLNGDAVKLQNQNSATPDSTDYGAECEWYTAEAVLDPIYQLEKTEDLLLTHQTTFLAKKWEVDELEDMNGTVTLDDINYSGDWLSSQPAMIETYGSIHSYFGKKLSSYNGRLLLEGADMTLYQGYPFYSATGLTDTDTQDSWSYVWHIRVDGEEKIVITKDPSGSNELYYEVAGDYYSYPIAFLSYPDARAFMVDVVYTVDASSISPSSPRQSRVVSVIMHSFPQIDAAYAFFGFGQNPSGYAGQTPQSLNSILPDENKKVNIPDQLLLSSSSNPFIFPAMGRIDFDGDNILGTAMVTKALSQGQFGQYPLYVFTSSGIWTLGLNSEGEFVSKHAVSRDVALEGTIAPIDQAIVFTTKKGVMMLTGSDLVNISQDMNGKHYTLDVETAALLSERYLGDFSGASLQTETFLQFMESAKPAYDYAGGRLVFGSETYTKYMYVYRLSTNTWHKMTLIRAGSEEEAEVPDLFSVVRVVNSYPDAVLSLWTNEEDTTKIINLSTILIQDGTEDNAMSPGLIATRPIDFGLPDIYKSVTRVKIRGEVDRSNNHSPFKYILLGSNDGVNWAMLHSLRGPSFKLFRLIILTTLNSTERISYAEIEYEPRFTNKIR